MKMHLANDRMVYSACEMGVGREAISVRCEILNMPPPCKPSSQNALYQAHKEAVAEKLAKPECIFMNFTAKKIQTLQKIM